MSVPKTRSTISVEMDMVFIEGDFYVSSFCDRPREVTDLEVARYVTTQEEWEKIMGYNNSKFKGKLLPVTNISWWEALEYCNKLSEKYGLEPLYIIEEVDGVKELKLRQLDGKIVEPDMVDFKKTEGFRLPTEFEWEWFARGGNEYERDFLSILGKKFTSLYPPGRNFIDNLGKLTVEVMDEEKGISKYAWEGLTSESRTHEVGLKIPNVLGLYDCCGNVNEYCYDTYHFDMNVVLDKERPYIYKKDEKKAVIKGGSYASVGFDVIPYCRRKEIDKLGDEYWDYKYTTGIRVVRTIHLEEEE